MGVLCRTSIAINFYIYRISLPSQPCDSVGRDMLKLMKQEIGIIVQKMMRWKMGHTSAYVFDPSTFRFIKRQYLIENAMSRSGCCIR